MDTIENYHVYKETKKRQPNQRQKYGKTKQNLLSCVTRGSRQVVRSQQDHNNKGTGNQSVEGNAHLQNRSNGSQAQELKAKTPTTWTP